jgi:RNA polymerase sigma factor (sigma-70 family)
MDSFEAHLTACWPALEHRSRRVLPTSARGHLCPQDLVQDVLLSTCRRASSIEADPALGLMPYLQRALTNRVRSEHRRQRPNASIADAEASLRDTRPSPLDRVLAEERRRAVRRAVASLDPQARRIVIARYARGLAWSDVAAAVDAPSPDAARVAASRAVARLASQLE